MVRKTPPNSHQGISMTTATPPLATLLTQIAAALTDQLHQPEPPPIPEPRQLPPRVLLTVEEAAQQLGIGRSMAFRLIRNGELQSVRIGRLRRVSTSAIADYAAALTARQTTSQNR